MKRLVSILASIVIVLVLCKQAFGAQISFGWHYVDSNTYGYVTRASKDFTTDYVLVDLDRIKKADGSDSNYAKIRSRYYIATTAEVLADDYILYGGLNYGVLNQNKVYLKRRVGKGASVSFFAMGNDARYDCQIKGILTVY